MGAPQGVILSKYHRPVKEPDSVRTCGPRAGAGKTTGVGRCSSRPDTCVPGAEHTATGAAHATAQDRPRERNTRESPEQEELQEIPEQPMYVSPRSAAW